MQVVEFANGAPVFLLAHLARGIIGLPRDERARVDVKSAKLDTLGHNLRKKDVRTLLHEVRQAVRPSR